MGAKASIDVSMQSDLNAMNTNDQKILIVIGALVLLTVFARRRWRPSTTAFGMARWASEKIFRVARMLGDVGLILGRTMTGTIVKTCLLAQATN
jgi:hypothetical protein